MARERRRGNIGELRLQRAECRRRQRGNVNNELGPALLLWVIGDNSTPGWTGKGSGMEAAEYGSKERSGNKTRGGDGKRKIYCSIRLSCGNKNRGGGDISEGF